MPCWLGLVTLRKREEGKNHFLHFYSDNFHWNTILTHTYSMVQDIWKADCYSACQKISFLTEPEGSSPCSKKPATGPYPEPAESSSPLNTTTGGWKLDVIQWQCKIIFGSPTLSRCVTARA
jgi:hypothetical protein